MKNKRRSPLFWTASNVKYAMSDKEGFIIYENNAIKLKETENRLFFVDERYEQGFPLDANESFCIGKSIAGLKLNQSAQNPITYLYPPEKDKIHI